MSTLDQELKSLKSLATRAKHMGSKFMDKSGSTSEADVTELENLLGDFYEKTLTGKAVKKITDFKSQLYEWRSHALTTGYTKVKNFALDKLGVTDREVKQKLLSATKLDPSMVDDGLTKVYEQVSSNADLGDTDLASMGLDKASVSSKIHDYLQKNNWE